MVLSLALFPYQYHHITTTCIHSTKEEATTDIQRSAIERMKKIFLHTYQPPYLLPRLNTRHCIGMGNRNSSTNADGLMGKGKARPPSDAVRLRGMAKQARWEDSEISQTLRLAVMQKKAKEDDQKHLKDQNWKFVSHRYRRC